MRKAIRATRAPSDYLKADGTKLRVLWNLERLYFPGYRPTVSLMCYGATAFEESEATPATSIRLLRAFFGFSLAPPCEVPEQMHLRHLLMAKFHSLLGI